MGSYSKCHHLVENLCIRALKRIRLRISIVVTTLLGAHVVIIEDSHPIRLPRLQGSVGFQLSSYATLGAMRTVFRRVRFGSGPNSPSSCFSKEHPRRPPPQARRVKQFKQVFNRFSATEFSTKPRVNENSVKAAQIRPFVFAVLRSPVSVL